MLSLEEASLLDVGSTRKIQFLKKDKDIFKIMTIISTTVVRNPLEEMEYPSWSTKESEMQFLDAIKKWRMISIHFQGKPFNTTVIQSYAPTSNAEEAEDGMVLWRPIRPFRTNIKKKNVLFIIGNWNAKVGSQETPGVTGKFGLAVQNEAGQRLIEFSQENILVIANTLFQQNKRRLYTWTSPDG